MNPKDIIHSSWQPLMSLLHQDPLLHLSSEILPNIRFYPEKENIFKVFRMPLQNIKVVILGQDPYHGPEQATGLAFAVNREIPAPPSLKNIYKEVCTTTGLMKFDHQVNEIPVGWKTLEHWEKQGVFLLNTALTVEASNPNSHAKEWEFFTKKAVQYIAYNKPAIWLLWGRQAQNYTICMNSKSLVHVDKYNSSTIEHIPTSEDFNYILKAAHPAAESYRENAGFYGKNHFNLVNKILSKKRQQLINW